jgi:hypothetical protein
MSLKVINALVWIKGILESKNVPYQIVGGFAAHIYGSSRPVADIDLYIPREFVTEILSSVQNYISKPLTYYIEGLWDVEYFQLIFQEQKIEIGLSPGTKIFNRKIGEWVELDIDYSNSIIGTYKNIKAPVIPISELIFYKAVLDREVDLIDIIELNRILMQEKKLQLEV